MSLLPCLVLAACFLQQPIYATQKVQVLAWSWDGPDANKVMWARGTWTYSPMISAQRAKLLCMATLIQEGDRLGMHWGLPLDTWIDVDETNRVIRIRQEVAGWYRSNDP